MPVHVELEHVFPAREANWIGEGSGLEDVHAEYAFRGSSPDWGVSAGQGPAGRIDGAGWPWRAVVAARIR